MRSLSIQLRCPGEQRFALAVDCQLPAHGVTAIYGASGSGKTTLLDCIAGLRQPEPGSTIQLGDVSLLDDANNTPVWQRRIGYVFNNARLFPHLNVQGNLLYAARRASTASAPLATVAQWLQLDDLLARMPDTLSAGQQQRVAIARALMSAPQLLLLDEPFANLDSRAARHCLNLLRRLSRTTELPMLFVSHDIEEVSQLADYLVLLEAGRVTEHGPLLQLSGRLDTGLSQNERAAAIVEGEVIGRDTHYNLTELNVEGERLFITGDTDGAENMLRVRIPARDVSICRERPRDSSILNILPVRISAMASSDNARVMLRLALGEQFLLARITQKSADALKLNVGDTVYAQVKSAALLNAGMEKL